MEGLLAWTSHDAAEASNLCGLASQDLMLPLPPTYMVWLPQLHQWLQMELFRLPIVLYLPVFGLPLVLSGAKTSNGSLGSPKSSFSFFCVLSVYQWPH